jgi:hypothetical protein
MRRPAIPWRLATAAAGLLLVGCVPGVTTGGIARADAPPVPFPECRADVYEFAGESTFNALGVVDHLPADPGSHDRLAMIWITRDRLPYDAGPAGGPVEGTRMMCFEFPDGSGGSEWPVDDAWTLPQATAAGDGAGESGVPVGPLLLVLGVVAVIGVSAFAFRGRR